MFSIFESYFTLCVLPKIMAAKWVKAILSPAASLISLGEKVCVCTSWREKVAQSFGYTITAMKMTEKSVTELC